MYVQAVLHFKMHLIKVCCVQISRPHRQEEGADVCMQGIFTCGLNINRIEKSLREFLVLGCLNQKGPQPA